MLNSIFYMVAAAYLGLMVCFPFVTSQVQPIPQATGGDDYYWWSAFNDTLSPNVDVSGLSPLQWAMDRRILEVKLPFAFPFYGRPQTTIYIHPDGFIFPHRLSSAYCPHWSCLDTARDQSFITPLGISPSRAAMLSGVSTQYYHRSGVTPDSNAVVVTWSAMHGAQCDTAPSSCEALEFRATLYESGKITFFYQHLPNFTDIRADLARHAIGLRDAAVLGGYGSIRTNEDIHGDLISTLDLNAFGQLYGSTRVPKLVSFQPLRDLIQNGTARGANSSRAGQAYGRDCSQAQSRDLCNQMPIGFHCFWCVGVNAGEFQPFCGRREDSDPRADIIFAGKCGDILTNFGDDEVPLDVRMPSPHPKSKITALGHDYYTTHVDDAQMHVHAPGHGSDDDDDHQSAHSQHLPERDYLILNTRYNGDSQLTLPFKFPFYQRSLEELTISHNGFLFVPGSDCTSCADPLVGDPLLYSHIAPLAGIWNFGPDPDSAMFRYDAVDNSFVHFEWANAQLSVFVHDCPALHCHSCLCPVKDIDPVSFSATLYRDGSIMFHYWNFTTPMHEMPFDKYFDGHIGIHDLLVAELPKDKTSATIFEYRAVHAHELHDHEDHSEHCLHFRPTTTPTCNQARTRQECESNPGRQEPCLWCEATAGYSLRSERAFCSASRQTYRQEVNTSSLRCRYFGTQANNLPPPPSPGTRTAGARKSSGSAGVIAGAVLGGMAAVALVAAVLRLRRKRLESLSGEAGVNFKQLSNNYDTH